MTLRSATRTRNVASFVQARREGWERLEALVERIDAAPLALAEVEELDRLYRRAVGDLAWSHSAFPGSDAEGYLRQLTARAFGLLHRRRRGSAALAALYREEVPEAFVAGRGAFLLALGLLVAGGVGGALAVAIEPGAAELLVPEAIRAAVAAGRDWTRDLLSVTPGVGGSWIIRNNLTVASLAVAGGLSAGVVTAALLVTNGLVIGAVAAVAWRGVQGHSFLSFLSAHGPGELLAFLLAAQGGLRIAEAILLPGEAPRGALLAVRGREAARLLAAVAPILVLVGILEATVSPAAAFGPATKAGIGVALAGALLAWLWRGPPR